MSEAKEMKCTPVFKMFFPAKIFKTRAAKRPKRIRFFCNTAVRENDIPRSIVDALKLKDAKEEGKVTAYISAPGADKVKASFIVVEDQTRPDGVYNIGVETLRRMKAKVECAGYVSARRRTRTKQSGSSHETSPATSDGGSPSRCPDDEGSQMPAL